MHVVATILGMRIRVSRMPIGFRVQRLDGNDLSPPPGMALPMIGIVWSAMIDHIGRGESRPVAEEGDGVTLDLGIIEASYADDESRLAEIEAG